MIELPESVTLANQLTKAIKGKGSNALLRGEKPASFRVLCRGTGTLWRAPAGGKQRVRAVPMEGMSRLNWRICGGLDFNDGVNLRFLAPGQAEPKGTSLPLRLTMGARLGERADMGALAFAQGQTITRIPSGGGKGTAAGGRIRCGLFGRFFTA